MAAINTNNIKIVCISDTHNFHDNLDIPDGDILIHAGDFTTTGTTEETESFMNFIKRQPHKHKIIIAGNHDLTMDNKYPSKHYWRFHSARMYLPEDYKSIQNMVANSGDSTIHYLKDKSINLYGYNFYGSPWQPTFCNWAFNLNRGEQIAAKWKKIPTETDILITHGPPLGYGDKVVRDNVGCADLLETIPRIKPLYHIFGHIHEGYGTYKHPEFNTTFINASSCNYTYDRDNLNPPITFTLKNK